MRLLKLFAGPNLDAKVPQDDTYLDAFFGGASILIVEWGIAVQTLLC
jgi:hypothetical protein